MQSPSACLLVAAASVAFGLEVHEPAYAAGVYAETRALFSPQGYVVNGLLTLVDGCPCHGAITTERGSGANGGLILAVAEGACTAEAQCTAAEAACAAKQAEASGVLLPEGYGDERDGVGGYWQPVSWRRRPLEAACKQSPLPTAFISRDLTALLRNASRAGDAVNVTMSEPGAESFDCAVLDHVPVIFLGFVPAWMAATALWAVNNVRNWRHVRNLHHRLSLVPALGLAQAGLSVLFYAHCPWDMTPLIFFLGLCWVLVTIAKEPLVILCFVLVSKGWGITRDELSTCDSVRIGACIVVMFVAMAVQMAVDTHLAVLATVALYLILCLEVSASIKTNLLVLKAQLCALRQYSIDPRSTPAYHKYYMFRRLTGLAGGYVLVELGLHLSFEFTGQYGGVWWPFVLAHQGSELFFAMCIGYTFRATPLNALFQRVQPQVTELADRILPQITTVEIGPDVLGGSNLLAWRQDMQLASVDHGGAAATQAEPPPTLLIINPGDMAHETTPSGKHEVGKPVARAQVAPAPSPANQQQAQLCA